MTTIQKILLAVGPAYFYFVPYLLFHPLYKKYIGLVYAEFKTRSPGEYEEKKMLRNRVSRILEFVSFLSIVAITFFAIVFNKDDHRFFYATPLCAWSTLIFLGFSTWVIVVNLVKKFIIHTGYKILEVAIVLCSIPMLYRFAV